MGDHSDIVGGSTARRVINCPASVLRSRGRKNPPGLAAMEGTALHAAMNLELMGIPSIGMEVPVEDERGATVMFVITPALYHECVAPALAMVQSVRDKFPRSTVQCEQVVAFPGLPGVFGRTDLCNYVPDAKEPGRAPDRLAAVVDFKFGRREPHAEDQMAFYTCCLCNDETGIRPQQLAGVAQVVIAPRVSSEPIFYKSLLAKDLADFANRLTAAVALAEIPGLPGTPGDHCRFCPAADTCPERIAEVRDAVARSPAGQGAEDRRALLILAKRCIDWAEAVMADTKDAMMRGAQVTGFGLGVRGTRVWKDQERAALSLRAQGVEPFEQSMISPAQAEAAGADLGEGDTALARTIDSKPAVVAVPMRGFRPYQPPGAGVKGTKMPEVK